MRQLLRSPMARAAIPMKRRNGNSILVSVTVRAYLEGELRKPGAMSLTI